MVSLVETLVSRDSVRESKGKGVGSLCILAYIFISIHIKICIKIYIYIYMDISLFMCIKKKYIYIYTHIYTGIHMASSCPRAYAADAEKHMVRTAWLARGDAKFKPPASKTHLRSQTGNCTSGNSVPTKTFTFCSRSLFLPLQILFLPHSRACFEVRLALTLQLV